MIRVNVEAVAHHEAGHAVAAFFFRHRITSVTIKPGEDFAGKSISSPQYGQRFRPDVEITPRQHIRMLPSSVSGSSTSSNSSPAVSVTPPIPLAYEAIYETVVVTVFTFWKAGQPSSVEPAIGDCAAMIGMVTGALPVVGGVVSIFALAFG